MLTGDILKNTARRLPQKPAILCGERVVDFAALDAAANRFANTLLAMERKEGSRIAILARNSLEYAVIYFGAARAGVVLVSLSTRYAAHELADILIQSHVDLLIAEGEFLVTVDEARWRVPGLTTVLTIGDEDHPNPAEANALSNFMAQASDEPPGIAIDPNAPFCMTLTGGTTGLPKGVLVSHNARYGSAVSVVRDFGLSEDDVIVLPIPLFHIAGLFVWYQPSVLVGASAVFLPKWDVPQFMEAVERHGVTAASTVPTQLHDLLSHPHFQASRLKSLKKIVYAGAPMPANLLENLQQALPKVEFIENYGQSEAGPLTVRRGADLPEKAGSVGHALSDVELAVFDPNGRPVAPGEVGEVVARGAHLSLGYDNAAATAALYKNGDGWLWTGDVGTMDDDGFITLLDRSRDMIVSGGENIYPKEIENSLCSHSAVSECAVFGIPDERFGEVPIAHVVLRPGAEATEDELTTFCAAVTARFKRPRRIVITDRLPKTAIGKIRKNLLREPYWQGQERQI